MAINSQETLSKHIFLNENARISIQVLLKFVAKGEFNQQYSSIGSDDGLALARDRIRKYETLPRWVNP